MISVGSILSGTFRYARNNVPAILVWSTVFFLFGLLTMAMMPPYSAPQPGMPAARDLGRILLPMLVMLLASVVVWAGAFRGIFFPDQGGPGYLRLGLDELRLLACMLVLIVGFYLIVAVGGIAIGLVFAVAGVITGTIGGLTSAYTVIFGMLGCAIILGAWLGTRFSLAGPLTLLDRKIIIGPSWRLTRGNFWRLLGAYLVIALMIVVVYVLLSLSGGGQPLAAMLSPTDPTSQASLGQSQAASLTFSLKTVVLKAVESLVGGFAVALEAGVVGIATQQLLDRGGGQRLTDIFE